jgi:hypothetical protein
MILQYPVYDDCEKYVSQSNDYIFKAFIVEFCSLETIPALLLDTLLTSFILFNSFVLLTAIPRDSNSFIHQPYLSGYSFLVDVVSQIHPHYVI